MLLLATDERFAQEGDFKVGLTETRLNMVLPRFVVEMARVQIPPQHLTRVVAFGDRLSPSVARDIGLYQTLCAEDELIPLARTRARELSQLPPAFHANKLALRREAAALGHASYVDELNGFTAVMQAASPPATQKP